MRVNGKCNNPSTSSSGSLVFIHEPNSVIENENIPHYMYINVFGDNLSTLLGITTNFQACIYDDHRTSTTLIP